MARNLSIVMLAATLALVGAAAADEIVSSTPIHPVRLMAGAAEERAALVGVHKADGDTVYVLGGPGRIDGSFETATGIPEWHGWTSQDFTNDGRPAWHISTERILVGARTMVCGVEWPLPGGGTDFGYGNMWNKLLVFTHAVPDPDESVDLRLTGTMLVDTELDYDYVYLEVKTAEGWQLLAPNSFWHGAPTNPPRPIDIDYSLTLAPEHFTGPGASQIKLRFNFDSDVYWADEDQLYDSDGACWLDDLTVSMDGSVVDVEDFEDGVSDLWIEEMSPGVGDYAQLFGNLQDLDPCRSNSSVQVIFIDDGVVVPGTGGSPCITWCYGPNGYIVNNSGGPLGGPSDFLKNGINSPPLQWVDGCDAAQLTFGVYMHEEHSATSPGVHYRWFVRSTTSSDPADLEAQEWVNEGGHWYGGPAYHNHNIDLTGHLEPGRQWFQVQLLTHESGYLWDYIGVDGTPAPYYDNVRVLCYPYPGPSVTYHSLYVAQDNFPEQGDLDFANLASNSVRFDMARNISPGADLRNDPGDSIYVDVVPVRLGSTLLELPRMVVRMKANPLFDGVRVLPPGFSQSGDIVEGVVVGDSTWFFGNTPILIEDRYNFDLPDTGFFYPGDVIHYYFDARDQVGGDVGHTMLPGDTTGFASFRHDLSYPSDFICRALPSLHDGVPGAQPNVLLWNDFANRGGENEWCHGLNGAGMVEGLDYDIYYTNRPDAGEGNGLGGRATSAVLDGYDILLYTSGNLSSFTLANGDFATDPSRDLQLLDAWFARGGKKVFMTGDDLVFDASQSGSAGQAFVNNFVGVEIIDRDLRPFITNQSAPLVRAIDQNPIFVSCDRWIAYGGCLGFNTFDVLEPRGTTVSLAEFTDPHGNTGVYPYSAGVYHYNEMTDTELVLLPYDLMFVYNAPGYTPPGGVGPVAARSIMLRDVLNYFGLQLSSPIGVGDTPAVRELAVSSYPNPFNPRATIALDLPRAAEASLRIYNLRGELVRTLVDGVLPAGLHEVVWDGRDQHGAQSASGVYFAEAKAVGQTRVTRMALVK